MTGSKRKQQASAVRTIKKKKRNKCKGKTEAGTPCTYKAHPNCDYLYCKKHINQWQMHGKENTHKPCNGRRSCYPENTKEHHRYDYYKQTDVGELCLTPVSDSNGLCDSIIYYNDKDFGYMHMDDILDSCTNKIIYQIEYKYTNSKELHIRMYRIDA